MIRRVFQFLFFLVLVTIAAAGYAEVPRLISYQGTITGSSGPLDGSYDLGFAIYADSTGGAALWSELHSGVPVTYGIFNVILGRFTAVPDDLLSAAPRWIGITVGSDPEIAPRMRMTAVPWAMRAAVAESSLVAAADDDWAYSGANIYRLAGNVGIGTSAPNQKLDVRDATADAYMNVTGQDDGKSGLMLHGSSAYLYYDEAAPEVRLWNAVTGGNAGDIAFGTNNLERVRIKRDGQVGIGVTAPTDLLEVAGTAKMTGFKMPTGAASGYVLTSDAGGTGSWQAPAGGGSDGDWTILGSDQYSAVSGNVGIGISGGYSGKLHVVTAGNDQVAYFEQNYVNGDSAAVFAKSSGKGAAVYAVNTEGTVGAIGDYKWGTYGLGSSGNWGVLGYTSGVYGSNANANKGGLGSLGYGAYGIHNAGNEGRLGTSDYAVHGVNTNSNEGWLGGTVQGAYGKHGSSGNWGYIGSIIYAVYGFNALGSNHGYLGSEDYGAYGGSSSGHHGYLGGGDYGAYGENSSGAYGFLGGDTTGVYGYTATGGKAAVYGQGGGYNSFGVKGQHSTTGNHGVLGYSMAGVMGRAYEPDFAGVVGYHGNNMGTLGQDGMGVHAFSSTGTGVSAEGGGYGVYTQSSTGYGIYAKSTSGYAGYFQGDVHVTGTLSKAAGSFVIDHPLDPQNKLLRHMFVESPENLCIYRGKTALDASGEAVVTLPSYFAALTKEDEATVSLTSVGRPFLTGYEWLSDHSAFKVFGEAGREISWVAYADRDDPAVRKLTRPVEEDKGPDNKLCDRGVLINP